jgi:ATP-binding cassette subfamily B protein
MPTQQVKSAVPSRQAATMLAALGPLLRRYWPHWIAVGLTLPLSAGMAMLVPYMTKVAIDTYIIPASAHGQVSAVWEPMLWLIGATAGIVVLGYASDAIYVSVLQRAGHGLIADLRAMLYARTLRLPRAYFDTHPIGTILTRVTSDFEAIQESLASGVLSLLVELVKSITYVAMMFFLNWRLTLVLLPVLPVLAVLIQVFQSRIRHYFFVSRQALSEATGFLQECLNGMKTVQLFGAERQVLATFVEKNRRFLHSQHRSNWYDALLFSMVEGVTTLSLALMLWYSAGELLAGVVTLGVLVAFIEYIQRLFVPVREFSQQIAVMQRAVAALDHINDLFRTGIDPAETVLAASSARGGKGFHETLQRIDFEDLRFKYGDGPEVLKGVSFSIQKGQTLAIVGATGSGKSTVVRLLTRAYSGYQGSIRINGEELREISADRLARLISVVHQNVFLFRGSVAFNIGLERGQLDRAAIEAAARYVNADSFIAKLDAGYDSIVAPGGGNLSTGQGQLIALARAVAAETDLIVLDEATASVDSMTEQLIQRALERLYADKTVIAIAHRLSTIRRADTIVVLDKGVVAEIGNHEQLLARRGLYAALVGEMDKGERPVTSGRGAAG